MRNAIFFLLICLVAPSQAISGGGFARGEPWYEDWKVSLECIDKVDGQTVKRGDIFYHLTLADGSQGTVAIKDGGAKLEAACRFVKPSRIVDEMRFYSDLYHDPGNFE